MSTRLLPNLLYVMQWIFNRVNVQSIESVALGTFWTPIYEIHDVLDTNRLHWCRWGVFYFSVIWRWGESAYEQLSLWQSTGSARFLILFYLLFIPLKTNTSWNVILNRENPYCVWSDDSDFIVFGQHLGAVLMCSWCCFLFLKRWSYFSNFHKKVDI